MGDGFYHKYARQYFNNHPKSWLFLILSGLATGASWLCYYKALQIGEVSKVVPIDKLSVVITLVLAFVFLSVCIVISWNLFGKDFLSEFKNM